MRWYEIKITRHVSALLTLLEERRRMTEKLKSNTENDTQ
jgi:hypothetical protein